MGQQSQCPICGGVFVIPVAAGMAPAQPGWAAGYPPQTPGYYPQGPAGPAYPGYPTYPGAFPPGGYPPGAYPGGYAGGPMPGAAQPWPGQEPAPGQPAFSGGPAVVQPDGMASAAPPAPFTDFQVQTEPAPTPVEAAAVAAPAEEPKPEPPPEKQEPRIVRIPCPQGHELQTPMDMVQQDVLCPICNTQFHLRYEDSIEFKEEQAELRRLKAERMNQVALKWSIGAAIAVVLLIAGMMIYLAFTAPAEPSLNPPDQPAAEEPASNSQTPAPADANSAESESDETPPEPTAADSDESETDL